MTKRIIDGNNEYVISALTWGERNAVLDEASEITESGKMTLKSGTLRTLTILLGVKSPKLEMRTQKQSEMIVRELYCNNKPLPYQTLEHLYNEIEKEQTAPLETSPEPSSPTKASENRPATKSKE